MDESDIGTVVRPRRLSGGRSARTSKCSSNCTVLSFRQSITSLEHSISMEEDVECWTDHDSTASITGLTESAVDSEDDELESEETSRDALRESLEKSPADRREQDVRVLLDFTQHLQAFANMTLSMREDLCKVMIFSTIDDAGTVIFDEDQEIDSWSVIIQGQIEIIHSVEYSVLLSIGDSFGLSAEHGEKSHSKGVIRTKSDDCQLVRIAREDYVSILNRGKENIRRHEEDGRVVMITEERPHPNNPGKKSHVVIKGTIDQLVNQLINIPAADPTYDEDFLLTYRIVIDNPTLLCNKFLEWFSNPNLRPKVARIVLLWVKNHFCDFDTNSHMIEFLEKFEISLDEAKMHGHLNMLNFAVKTQSKPRILILSKSNRDEALQFSFICGPAQNSGVFVSQVDKASKAEAIGLKRGDQILLVNGKNVTCLSHGKVVEILRSTTHLSLTVQTNLSAFKDVLKSQESSSPKRTSKRFEFSLVADNGKDYDDKTKSGWLTMKRNKNRQSRSSFMIAAPKIYLGKLWSMVHPASPHKSDDEADSQATDEVRQRTKGRKNGRMIVPSIYGSRSNPDLTKLDLSDVKSDLPEHILKIYISDQSYKLLFARKETNVKQVIAEALHEFELDGPASNYCLCEVTISETGLVKQRRLPDDMKNLADRLGINNRYYLKNNSSSEPLVTLELANELKREFQVNLLTLSPVQVAVELTLEDFALFVQIEVSEFIDDLFQKTGKTTPNLDRFSELANREMFWVITEICREQNTFRRMKTIKKFIKIADRCRQLRNFNSMFNIISGLSHNAVSRLKTAWEKLPLKHQNRFTYLQDLMNPSRNMSKYRNLVNCDTIQPPIIPFFPVLKKDLTFIHLGNDTKVEGLINFEKFRMIAKEIRNVQYMRSVAYGPERMFDNFKGAPEETYNSLGGSNGAPYGEIKRFARKKSINIIQSKKEMLFEEAQLVRRVKAYLKNVEVITDEGHLLKLSKDAEAPKSVQKPSLSNPASPASANLESKVIHNRTPSAASQQSFGSNPILHISASSSPKDGRTHQQPDRCSTPIPALSPIPTNQCPPSPKVVRRFIPSKPVRRIHHVQSHSDVSESAEETPCDHKVAAASESLSAMRRSTLTWSCVSTDSGVSSRSYSSQQPAVSSASSVDADGEFRCTPSGSKAGSSLEVSRAHRYTSSNKQSTNYRYYQKKPWQRNIEPLSNLIQLSTHETHSRASSSPTLPTIAVDETDDSHEEPVFNFRQGVRVLPPLPHHCQERENAILHKTAAVHHSAENDMQQASRATVVVRRAHSDHELR